MGVTEELLDNPDVAAAMVRKLDAEAYEHSAKARQATAEAAWKELEVESGHIELSRLRRVYDREEQSNLKHRVYPFTESVSASSVKQCIHELDLWHRQDPSQPIEIIFTSPGGSVVDGLALFDHIKYLQSKGTDINTVALGMAASMAGILLQAGTKRIIGKEAWLMIHEVSFGAGGKIGEVEDTTEWVKAVQRRVLAIFAERSNLTVKQLDARWKRKDWWIDSDEAMKLGLVDEVR